MDFVFVKDIISRRWNVIHIPGREVDALTLKSVIVDFYGFEDGIGDSIYLCCNGRKMEHFDRVQSGDNVMVLHRLRGGKGGFGSMLRAIGAQIEKTTNREACRDLSGRRLRDINEEMRLKKWIAKQVEREQEKEMKRLEKLERKLSLPKHEFEDLAYEKDRSSIPEKVNDALLQGLKLQNSLKRSATEEKNVQKKSRIWYDVDDEDDVQDDEDDDQIHSSMFPTCGSNKQDVKDNSPLCGEDHVRDECRDVGTTSTSATSSENTCSGSPNMSPKSDSRCPSLMEHKVVMDSNPQEDSILDLNRFNSAEELESLGLNQLKLALSERGLKCGGTLKERAERLYSVKGLSNDQIDPSLFAKKVDKPCKSQ